MVNDKVRVKTKYLALIVVNPFLVNPEGLLKDCSE
jgi:flagellar assembly factor FliW